MAGRTRRDRCMRRRQSCPASRSSASAWMNSSLNIGCMVSLPRQTAASLVRGVDAVMCGHLHLRWGGVAVRPAAWLRGVLPAGIDQLPVACRTRGAAVSRPGDAVCVGLLTPRSRRTGPALPPASRSRPPHLEPATPSDRTRAARRRRFAGRTRLMRELLLTQHGPAQAVLAPRLAERRLGHAAARPKHQVECGTRWGGERAARMGGQVDSGSTGVVPGRTQPDVNCAPDHVQLGSRLQCIDTHLSRSQIPT
jgi:hypothetical protein